MKNELDEVKEITHKMFADFGIEMEMLRAYEGINHIHLHLVPKTPVRMHEITGYLDDLRFALGRHVIKIEAPVMNRKEIKISILKEERGVEVWWSKLHEGMSNTNTQQLPVPLGMSEDGQLLQIDITTLPHLLVGGRSCSGKSNFVHGVLNSLIMQFDPDMLRLILIDPTAEELSKYKGLPHLMIEPISSNEKTIMGLKWACKEMERRYEMLAAKGFDSIIDYRSTVVGRERIYEPMPYILVVIDEMADVMSEYGDEAEKMLRRLAMMSRMVGIHLLLTTVSSEPRIVRNMIRANIPAVLCFSTDTKAASETFIYNSNAHELIGRGSALFTSLDAWQQKEVHVGVISDQEINANVAKVKRRLGAVDEDGIDLNTLVDYHFTIFSFDEEDDLYEEAKKAVVKSGKASTSYLQRILRIGYSRAARLIDLLEERGVIGPADGSNPREVLE
jgi:DNA segregation ATPase FtsK/SpoIIIE, S-DNA-T family